MLEVLQLLQAQRVPSITSSKGPTGTRGSTSTTGIISTTGLPGTTGPTERELSIYLVEGGIQTR